MISSRFYLPQPYVDELKRLSKDTGLPAAEHVRRALGEYIDRLAKDAAQKVRTVRLEG